MGENMINVYEQVERNKLRSGLVIGGFILFVSLILAIIGFWLESDFRLIIGAIIFSSFSSLLSYFWGEKIILKLERAKPANKKEHFNFYTVAENLALAARISIPGLYVIESPALNAFAAGRDPNHAVVCITTGLLKELNRSELEGVVAHEISHIASYDTRLMSLVAILVGALTLLSDWILRSSRFSERKKTNPLFLFLGFLALLLTPLLARIIQLAVSRSREYLADALGVKLTRQPQGLVSALKKLEASQIPLEKTHLATAHLYLVNPFKNLALATGRISRLFSTHPPLSERIALLEKMI